jgi:hypothetical protein
MNMEAHPRELQRVILPNISQTVLSERLSKHQMRYEENVRQYEGAMLVNTT